LNGWIEEQLIAWLGFREDMQNVIKDANIVCLPSYREGMPKILLEAAAVGRAIITTDVPGCRDCVSDEENGLLVPAGDSASLANAIQQLINAPGTRITMGKAGQEMIRYGFDIDTVNYQTIQLYNTLLSC
jgi:glycosyltransferase involved in cell wall biosynthesis